MNPLDDPFSAEYQLRLALEHGAQLLLNVRRKSAVLTHPETGRHALRNTEPAQRLVDLMADAGSDPVDHRVTITGRRSMGMHQYRDEREALS